MAIPITLQSGWNKIGWPPNAPDWTNEQLLEDLANKGFDPRKISRWFGGRYINHFYKDQVEIWKLEPGVGYDVEVMNPGPYDLPGSSTEVIKKKEIIKKVPWELPDVGSWLQDNALLAAVVVGVLVIMRRGLRL